MCLRNLKIHVVLSFRCCSYRKEIRDDTADGDDNRKCVGSVVKMLRDFFFKNGAPRTGTETSSKLPPSIVFHLQVFGLRDLGAWRASGLQRFPAS
jgi:hypothetical protein